MARFSKRSLEGALYIENRHAPPFPEALIQQIEAKLGHVPGLRVSGPVAYERAILRCCHCGVFCVKNPKRTRQRGYCAKCDAYHCDKPACLACAPIERRDERRYEELVTGRTPAPHAPRIVVPGHPIPRASARVSLT